MSRTVDPYRDTAVIDSRAPRTNQAYAAGAAIVGIALGALVAALALLAAVTGFCSGCEAYKLACLRRGRPFVSCPIPGARL